MYFKQRSIIFCLNYRAMYAASLVLLAYGYLLRFYQQPSAVVYDDVLFEHFIRTWYVPGILCTGAVILIIAAGAHALQRHDLRAKRVLYDRDRDRNRNHMSSHP
jgi:hypothetical protein